MIVSNVRLAVLSASLLLAAGSAQAVTVFTGSDDGALVGGPNPNSAAAEAAFLAAASGYGAVATETFEGQTLGYYSPIAMAGGASVSYVAQNYGPGFSGVSNITFGNVYGYNITPGGEKWFGFPQNGTSTATFSFAGGSNSFGFYMTGVQVQLFSHVLTLTQVDGSKLTFALPGNINGGVTYFGIVDSTAFTSVVVKSVSTGDAWGVDDISYNGAVVPEPATWALLIAGFGLVGVAARRRRAFAA